MEKIAVALLTSFIDQEELAIYVREFLQSNLR